MNARAKCSSPAARNSPVSARSASLRPGASRVFSTAISADISTGAVHRRRPL